MTITLTGTCPNCGYALKLRQAKTGVLYVGCDAYPRCDFRCAYDPILQQLRDHNARLEAELTLLQMQHAPSSPEEQKRAMTTWADVVKERRRAMTTWADVAHKWGATLREGRAGR